MLDTVHWRELPRREQSRRVLIDLRSPKEFARGHVPDAVNLALLDDDERHEVGKTFKERGKAEAVALGLEVFARKAPLFLTAVENLTSQGGELFVHCWRGGMRSRLVGMWLARAGFRVRILRGGYKSYRREVLTALDHLALHPKLVVNGRTGSGKTHLLEELSKEGLPVIDWEGLAHHRGSAFGALAQEHAPPTQQNFENLLAEHYGKVCHHKTLLLELENNIGPVKVPCKIRKSMENSPMIFVSRDFNDRVNLLARIYCKDWDSQREKEFVENVALLKKFIPKRDMEALQEAVRERKFPYAIGQLLTLRYDKAYDKSLERYRGNAIASFNLSREYKQAKDFLHSTLK
ncbi:MAG: tRNA 2-selenouridine(34) synthase MnmH [Deltaproteobacteria bacterium]|nr:tRNA 2-selenouridine(34) synthase MnmH [Deltaproteobacteria bacterium]